MPSEILSILKEQLIKQNLDGFVIPSNDAFQSEFTPAHDRRLEYITGFSGSYGVCVILKDKAALFTDGRYVLQAKDEVSKDFKIYNVAQLKPYEWVEKNLKSSQFLGIDPWLHSVSNMELYKKGNYNLTMVAQNPVDQIWNNRPAKIISPIEPHPMEHAGQYSADKLKNICSALENRNIDASVITSPDSICWLLNIRGKDLPCTPFILSYAILYQDGIIDLFTESERINDKIEKFMGDGVNILPPEELKNQLGKLRKKTVLLDPANAPYAIYEQCSGKVVLSEDLCLLPKACKNDVEIDGAITAHIRDGIALTKFLYWIDNEPVETLDELTASNKLLEFRKMNPEFIEPSFETIAGFGSNGAIVHYRVTAKSNKKFSDNGLFLVDSGGQYKDGTTDVTRTIAIGSPTDEQKHNFTLVLKGHIALSRAVFPEGTTGHQLDVLARQFLWREGLDYDHGTGHGVGSYLSVHEGPQRISKFPNNVPLSVGMIISNEPGYYKAGEYGIRIENLIYVDQFKKGIFRFKNLTMAPIDIKLIDISLLTNDEKDWLNNYHQQISKIFSPSLEEYEQKWLDKFIIRG
ncbi:aminopeptidase P family protein [Rickettsiales bacterium]|nr:aminopeptidase P family protein [Rickettsiales bacterium]